MKNCKKMPFWLGFGAIALLFLAGIGLFFHFRPRPVWIVEDRFVEVWENALDSSPLDGARVIPLSELGSLPPFWYGYRIGPAGESPADSEAPVRIYRELPGSGRYGEALALALDPWLVFRRFTSPFLSRMQAESGPGESGRIFLAGSDEAAVFAWTAQLLQEEPGVFSLDRDLWEQTGQRLFQNRQFQRGALTFSWDEIWPHLLGDSEIVWVYAPLSRIRALPLHETNILQADVFPVRPGWNQFGLQAEILWAVPFGSKRNRERLEAAEAWLQGAPFQTRLADALGWLAVHPEAPPFNPVTGNARIIWFTSSYVWEPTPLPDS